MSFMLASVSNLDEARLVHSLGVDIIDLKQPALGALGALDIPSIKQIVANLKPHATISATIGDLPMHPATLFQAVAQTAVCGVDFVKIGFFPEGDSRSCIQALAELTNDYALIAVLFADCSPDLELVATLAHAGFKGVMLDTMHKQQGSLTQCLSLSDLQTFVKDCHAHGLLCGLAGSLKITDIADLLPLKADYLGFRGALCMAGRRIASLDAGQIILIRDLLLNSVDIALQAFSSSTSVNSS